MPRNLSGRPGSRVALGLLAAVLVGCGSSRDGDTASPVGDRMQQATEALFAPIDPDGPGCSGAVNVDGEIVWSNAYGLASLGDGEAFTSDAVVDIGSASKQFTATAIGLLVEEGTLGLDDSLSEHVGDLPPWAGEVTIEQLVHHTSGIPGYIDLLDAQGVDLADPSDQDDALAALTGTQLEFEPGSRFSYSNSNYLLLAEVVQGAGGVDLATYLQREVFDPLGLAAQMTPGVELDGKAQSYEREDGDWVTADSPWTQIGDGAVQTTPEQLALWATQYWDSDLPPGLDRLRLGGAADMGDGGRYGLGIMEYPEDGVEGGAVLTHSGGWSGFDTGFVVDPDRRTAVAVTCNTPDGPVTSDVADDVLDAWTR
ncbi:MAG: serine hydrolase domain-containing protein [Microthrixaceae bacterium]